MLYFMYIFQEEKDMDCVEKWGVFELSFLGKCDGNPYIDYIHTGYGETVLTVKKKAVSL